MPDHLFAECDDLFDWAFESFADRPLVDTQTEITTVALTKCRTEPAVALYAAAPVSGYGHADDIVTYSFDLPESIAATVKSGSVVGTATVYLDGDEVGTVDLVTHKEYVSDFRTDTKDTALLLCALLFILAAVMAVKGKPEIPNSAAHFNRNYRSPAAKTAVGKIKFRLPEPIL